MVGYSVQTATPITYARNFDLCSWTVPVFYFSHSLLWPFSDQRLHFIYQYTPKLQQVKQSVFGKHVSSHKLSGSKYLFVIQRKETATFLCHATSKRKFQFVSFHFKENCRSKSYPEHFNDHSRHKSKQFKYPHMGFNKCSEGQFCLLLGFPNGWFPTGFP